MPERLRPHLTVRDIPLWLAAIGLAFLALTGTAQSLADPTLVPVVVIVVGAALVALAGGRLLVRRLAYRRITRIVIALLTLALVFFLPGALAFVMLPSALALLAVEMMAAPPGAAAHRARAPAGGSEAEGSDLDRPDEPSR